MEPRTRPDTAGTPRWVKVSGIIALGVFVLFVVMLLVQGQHRVPSEHMPFGR